jgi:hypothetical protein
MQNGKDNAILVKNGIPLRKKLSKNRKKQLGKAKLLPAIKHQNRYE